MRSRRPSTARTRRCSARPTPAAGTRAPRRRRRGARSPRPPRARSMKRMVGEHHALRLARSCPRCRTSPRCRCPRPSRSRSRRSSGCARSNAWPSSQELLVAHELRLIVVAQAARIVVVDVPQASGTAAGSRAACRPAPGPRRPRSAISAFWIGQRHLGGRRVLVERHRDAAQALRGAHRPVEARPVVADDREVLAALEALPPRAPQASARTSSANCAPGPGLPDAADPSRGSPGARRAPARGA